jgi:hypothetical protein
MIFSIFGGTTPRAPVLSGAKATVRRQGDVMPHFWMFLAIGLFAARHFGRVRAGS